MSRHSILCQSNKLKVDLLPAYTRKQYNKCINLLCGLKNTFNGFMSSIFHTHHSMNGHTVSTLNTKLHKNIWREFH